MVWLLWNKFEGVVTFPPNVDVDTSGEDMSIFPSHNIVKVQALEELIEKSGSGSTRPFKVLLQVMSIVWRALPVCCPLEAGLRTPPAVEAKQRRARVSPALGKWALLCDRYSVLTEWASENVWETSLDHIILSAYTLLTKSKSPVGGCFLLLQYQCQHLWDVTRCTVAVKSPYSGPQWNYFLFQCSADPRLSIWGFTYLLLSSVHRSFVYTMPGAHGGQKRAPGSLKLEFQTAVTNMWVLGIELLSSERAVKCFWQLNRVFSQNASFQFLIFCNS